MSTFIPPLPVEIWAVILTHSSLVGPHWLSQAAEHLKFTRKSCFRNCSLVCRMFRDILSTPFYQAQWALSYHNGSCKEALLFSVERLWSETVPILCSDLVATTACTAKQLVLSDALIFLMCQISTLRNTDKLSPLIAKKQKKARSDNVTGDFLEEFVEAETHSDTDVPVCIDQDAESIIEMYFLDNNSLVLDSPLSRRSIRRPRFNKGGSTVSSEYAFPCNGSAYLASKNEDAFAIATVLLQNGANINALENFALRRAAREGNVELLQLFLDHGANASCKNDEAIDFATQNGHMEAIALLIKYGGSALVALKKACVKGNCQVVDWLLTGQQSGEGNEWRSALQEWLCSEFEQDVVFRPSQVWETQNQFLQHPLVLASRHGSLRIIDLVIKAMEGCKNSNALNAAIRFAARDGVVESVRKLACHGADVGLALQSASKYSQIEIVELCLEEFAAELGLHEDMPSSSSSALSRNPCANVNILKALRSTTDPEIVDKLMNVSKLDWKQVTNNFLYHPRQSLLRSAALTIQEVPSDMGEDHAISVRTSSATRSYAYDVHGGNHVSMIVRNIDEDIEGDVRTSLLRSYWRRRFGDGQVGTGLQRILR